MSISSVASVDSIFQGLSNIQSQLDLETKRLSNKTALDAKQAKMKVQGFEKTVNKSSLDNAIGATDIGMLVKNQSRLNGYGALTERDKVDYVSFKAITGSETKLGIVADDGLKFRLLSKAGKEIANSDPESDGFKNWDKVTNGELKLNAGEYRIEITRTEKPEKGKKAQNYAVQVSQGLYTKDFDTIIKQPKAGQILPGVSVSQSIIDLGTMLTSQTYATGGTGTQKLISGLYGG